MDEQIKHRLIGVTVIIAVLMILAPIVLKTTEPSWHTLHRRGEYRIPKKPKPLPIVIVRKPVKTWQAPNAIKTINLDKQKSIKLVIKPVKPLPIKTRVETLPKVTITKPIVSVKRAKSAKVAARFTENHIKAKPKASRSHHNYHVQVATFSQKSNAFLLQKKLARMNLSAFVKPYSSKNGKNLYQVHLVNSFSKEKAKILLLKMKKKLFVNSLIRRG